MKRGRGLSRGFTVVETMIFLAVTSALLVSALTVVSGAQSRNEFKQAVNEFEQQVVQIMNNVANGYYPNIDSFADSKKCSDAGGNMTFTTIASGQGSSRDCIYVGRALQFTEDADEVQVYSLAGLRSVTTALYGKRDATKYSEVKPRVLETDNTIVTGAHPNWPSTTEQLRLKNGLTVQKVEYIPAGSPPGTPPLPTGGMVFYTKLASYSAGKQSSGAVNVDFSPIPSTSVTDTKPSFTTSLEDYSEGVGTYAGTGYDDPTGSRNLPDGVWICLDSGGTSQHAVLTIGGGSSLNQSATKLEIKNGSC